MEIMAEAHGDQPSDLVDAWLTLTGLWAGHLVRGGRVLDASPLIGPATKELLAASTELVVATPSAAVADTVGDLVHSGVRAYRTHLTDLPFESNSFDAVVSLGLGTSGDLDAIMSEFCRVIKPETGLMILSPDVHPAKPNVPPDSDDEPFRRFLDSKFPHVTSVAYSTYLAAAFFSIDAPRPAPERLSKAVPAGPTTGAHGPSRNKLIIGSHLPLDSYSVPGPILLPFDISKLGVSLGELNSLLRAYQARAIAAEQRSDDNARLLRELFLAEQVLAQEFDGWTRQDEVALLSSASEHEIGQIRVQLSQAQAHIDALQSTVSWRVTRPLRMVRRFLK